MFPNRTLSLRSLRAGLVGGLMAGLCTLSAGCSSSDQMATAPVSGKVTYNGQPVKGGSVMFSPVASGTQEPGKGASGTVKDDGTYVLGTYSADDGAVVGKHTVAYIPPTSEVAEAPEGGHVQAAPPSEYAGLQPKQKEVEVKSGSNTIDIELVK